MRCNACWQGLEGKAITTTCSHLLCPTDAEKILSGDGACPICDQVLSKSHMQAVDINPSDEWTRMAMAGMMPEISLKIALSSVMFYNGQKELEMQCRLGRMSSQCQKKCEMMQEKFSQKMEQFLMAYQKMTKRCQMMQQEIENLSKDKEELQEKFAEKSRQKRKLDELYNELRNELESVKRSAIQPANNFYSRPEPDLFANAPNMMDNTDHMRRGWSVPVTQGTRDDIWPQARGHNSLSSSPFEVSGGSRVVSHGISIDAGNRRAGGCPSIYGAGTGAGTGPANPSPNIRNLIFSPNKTYQPSRSKLQFTL